MSLLRTLALAATATALSLTLAGPAAGPASAADSSWGCGGWCSTAPTPGS